MLALLTLHIQRTSNLIGNITAIFIVNQILKYCGKEEIAYVTTLAGLVISLLIVLDLVQNLFSTVKNIFVF